MKMFRKNYVYYDTSEAVYFLAYRDGEVVGRISGILQKAANEKWKQKRVRFTRFDSIHDKEVARALFAAVEDWAREKGMEEVVGPLGFNDMEREGMLIEGFEHLATFEEQYNYDYYLSLLEECGYEKEVDWVESMVRAREEDDGKLARMSDLIARRYKLRYCEAKNTGEFIERYGNMFFDLIDASYSEIYGTVPFTDGMKKMLIGNFRLIIKKEYVTVILDEEENPVCLGLCFPSIAKAVQKSGGRLTPGCILRILKALKAPEILDLALIGVAPEWEKKGVSVMIASELDKMLRNSPTIQFAETNLNLEDNYAIRNLWKQRFDSVEHKRRRSFVKRLNESGEKV
ncbi:MAG: N-acetyltransferase [Lachnospiraceae bacterium]|nr:N-acetyltransferase [Lachnospiraceae bacterium]